MTNEERQELCDYLKRLRVPQICFRSDGEEIEYMAKTAADEIKRLEKEVARLKDEYGVLLERTTNMLDMTVR